MKSVLSFVLIFSKDSWEMTEYKRKINKITPIPYPPPFFFFFFLVFITIYMINKFLTDTDIGSSVSRLTHILWQQNSLSFSFQSGHNFYRFLSLWKPHKSVDNFHMSFRDFLCLIIYCHWNLFRFSIILSGCSFQFEISVSHLTLHIVQIDSLLGLLQP